MRKRQRKNYDMERSKWYIATAIGCLLFPVGYVWNIVNTVLDFRNLRHKNTAILYSAIGSAIFSAFMFMYLGALDIETNAVEELRTFLIMAAPYLLAGVQAIYLFAVYFIHARRCRVLNRTYDLIEREHITRISQLSEILCFSKRHTVKTLRSLIKEGYLQNAEIDEENDELVLKQSIWAKQRVICQNCGAELTVDIGRTLVCNYCGGALKAKRASDV